SGLSLFEVEPTCTLVEVVDVDEVSPRMARVALSATIYRVTLNISDTERDVYETVELRVAQHPSEDNERLLARILAYGLFYKPGLEMGRGLSETEDPALLLRDLTGLYQHWIEVGAPSADRIHLASKKSPRVSILAHKGVDALSREMLKKKLHRAEEIDVYVFNKNFIREAAGCFTRNSEWTLVRSEGELNLTIDAHNFVTELNRIPLPQPE